MSQLAEVEGLKCYQCGLPTPCKGGKDDPTVTCAADEKACGKLIFNGIIFKVGWIFGLILWAKFSGLQMNKFGAKNALRTSYNTYILFCR
jgi:hypothetical protein